MTNPRPSSPPALVRCVPRPDLYPHYGYSSKAFNTVWVRIDLPAPVHDFVLARELHRLRDPARNPLWRGIKSHVAAALFCPWGAVWCLWMCLKTWKEEIMQDEEIRKILNTEYGAILKEYERLMKEETAFLEELDDSQKCDSKRCRWTRDSEDSDIWLTGCGEVWCLNEGTLADNRIKFCPFCGRNVR